MDPWQVPVVIFLILILVTIVFDFFVPSDEEYEKRLDAKADELDKVINRIDAEVMEQKKKGNRYEK